MRIERGRGTPRLDHGGAGALLGLGLSLLLMVTAAPARAQTETDKLAKEPESKAQVDGFEMTDLGRHLMVAASRARAQTETDKPAEKPKKDPEVKVQIYGFEMTDFGHDFEQNDPNWFDVMRPTKLPAFKDEFGKDGRTYAGVRQTRIGLKTFLPTSIGELRTTFEWELFGVGVDAGQTTFRLRHAYGELGNFGAGQTWSPFMDPDVFPNSLEYWGPNGMVFFRNVQIRWMPIRGASRVIVALERPGASADGGIYQDRIELQNIKPRFPLPDFSAQGRLAGKWGHVQLAGLVRDLRWDDVLPDSFDLSGSAVGWGVNLSSNINIDKDVARLQVTYGQADENYMNDAPADIGIENNFGDPHRPIVGKAIPVLGIVAFYDRRWNDKFTSAIGYSRVDVDNTDGQLPAAFRLGQYALANVLWYPTKNLMAGGEFQWGQRRNHSDGFSKDDYRLQFGFRYNFSFSFEVGSD